MSLRARLPVHWSQLTSLPWFQAKKADGPLYVLSDHVFWPKKVTSVAVTQLGPLFGDPYSLKMPPAPQSGQAVSLQCGMLAGLKSMVFRVTCTLAVCH